MSHKSLKDRWAEETADDFIIEKPSIKLEPIPQKNKSVAKTFSEILKFNPYHDRLGRFTTPGAAASFTYRPGASMAHDNSIAREANRMKQANSVITRTDKMASYVVDQNPATITTGKREAVKAIRRCYQEAAITGGMRWDDEKQKVVVKRKTIDNIRDTAKKIVSDQEYEDQSTAQDYYDLHRKIKNTPINISDYDKSNIADWNDYRKQSFGNMTISRNGISVDSFYQELSGMFPHLFDSSKITNPADQLASINDTLRSLKPQKYRLSGAELDAAAQDLALQMINGYVAAVRK